jgi:hypothetical protein
MKSPLMKDRLLYGVDFAEDEKRSFDLRAISRVAQTENRLSENPSQDGHQSFVPLSR